MQSANIDSIEHSPLERPVSSAKYLRIHLEKQISQIAGTIEEFGFVNPILIGNDRAIVEGRGRLMAARQPGQAILRRFDVRS